MCLITKSQIKREIYITVNQAINQSFRMFYVCFIVIFIFLAFISFEKRWHSTHAVGCRSKTCPICSIRCSWSAGKGVQGSQWFTARNTRRLGIYLSRHQMVKICCFVLNQLKHRISQDSGLFLLTNVCIVIVVSGVDQVIYNY